MVTRHVAPRQSLRRQSAATRRSSAGGVARIVNQFTIPPASMTGQIQARQAMILLEVTPQWRHAPIALPQALQ
jgi:hypothetical protein